jgi:hypothetical protein
MRLLELFAICVLAYMIYSFVPSNEKTRDGMLCYMIEERGNDTTYTIFSGYGMRHSVESKVAEELVFRYQNKLLKDTMYINTSEFKIFGTCTVDTMTPPRLISFCAKEYISQNGKIESVSSEFCGK